jgi:hypothetical protein
LKDLIVLAADASIEATLRGLLTRPVAIGIRALQFDSNRHPGRDPGCYREAHLFLAPLRGQYRHALVVFDREGSGATDSAEAIEARVRELLDTTGWKGQADVVVIDPELEVWVWSDSPKVDEALFWDGRRPDLRAWVRSRGLWPDGHAKPVDPKRTVQLALAEVRIPLSSSIFAKLATSVSVERCLDPAFGRLRQRLRTWFPAN